MRKEKSEVSRKELYDQVWAEPMLKVAKKYGISGVGLAKICRRNNIPVPPRGFWARKQAGYKVKVLPLPSQSKESKIIINPQALTTGISLPQELSMAKKAVQKPLVVPETLIDPHPLVEKTAKVLSSRKPGENGLTSIGSVKALDIWVSPKQQSRALQIFDTILKTVESNGFQTSIKDSATSVLVAGIQIFFGIREELKRIPREPTKWERDIGRLDVYASAPSGNLILSINKPSVSGGRKNWKDGKKRLEDKLADFVTRLIDYSVLVKQEEEERQERNRRWEEERRQRIEREEEIRAEKEKFSQLMTFIQNWQQSELIRRFADAVEKKVRDSELSVDEEWLTWVRKQADRIDPLSARPSPDQTK
ncbi:MAG: hypothetical protein ACLQBD_28580 [Syntrophobacteraceae bacterium]